MQEYRIPWGQWYGQKEKKLTFPDGWEGYYCGMREFPGLSGEQILDKINHPVASETLEHMAAGKKSACIIIDDISRPTPGNVLLPMVIQKLVASGMDFSQIKVLVALGGHRPMTRQELERKVGRWVLEHVQVLNHSPYAADLVQIEDAEQVIKVNRNYMDAELKIAVGCIVPHTLAGFSGGAKAVIPGIGGIETLKSNHSLVFTDKNKSMSFKTSTCNPDNAMRSNMERIVGKAGLDFIVNVVLNGNMEIADVFCGHFIKAHRAACNRAMEILKTPLVRGADIVILSAYPKDTEYQQIGTCFAVLGHHKEAAVREDGTIVAMTAASEGAGFHALFGPGMSLFSPHDDNVPPFELKGRETLIFSDGVQRVDIMQYYREEAPEICGTWEEILTRLEEKYKGRKPLVAIYPMAAVQIGCMDTETVDAAGRENK